MQKVCQQKIKVKSINVTEGQSWAVYGDGELGVAAGAFLSVPKALLSLPSPTAQAWGLSCHRFPGGCKTLFFSKVLNPNASQSSWLCLLPAGTAAGEAPALPAPIELQGSMLTAAFPPCGLLGLAGVTWWGFFIAS